jgi:hypothetical protein
MDTGATNYLTSEMGKLSTQEPYRGHDQVRTANGAGMRISHVAQASLLAHNSQKLRLLMSFQFLLLHVVCCLFLKLLVIMMCSLNFIISPFLSRIGT